MASIAVISQETIKMFVSFFVFFFFFNVYRED